MKLSTSDLFKNLDIRSDKVIRLTDETLCRVQEIVLGIAEDVISVCEAENITYHITGGTALGAIRHHGFIPWDDDFDIDILSSDFDLFIQKLSERFPDKYWVNTCHTPGYGGCGNKVRLKGSIFRGRDDLDNDECGFLVDIFRIENTFDNIILRDIHGVFCLGLDFLLSCRNFYKNRALMLELAGDNKEAKRSFNLKINIGRVLSFLSVEKWAEITQGCYGLCKNNNSKYVTVPAGRKHYFGEMRLRSDFVDTAEAEFEGHTWKVPKDYIGYLKSMYGDNFMELPPEDQRENHVILELKFPDED